MNDVILLKLGEVVLKGLNRRSFEDKLMSNVSRRLRHYGSFQVYTRQSTIYVEPQGDKCDLEGAWKACRQVFGVVSVARAVPCEKTVEAIVETAKTYLRDAFAAAHSFKVESRRADKTFYLNSIQLSQAVGGDLAEAFPNVAVDVHTPDLTVFVEIREKYAYVHTPSVPGAGGLPIGISRTSVDAWLYPHLFHMDSQAGAPPDAFSAVGQNWGFPTYNWERMARDGYAWWRARMAKMAEYFDAFRIDHILGFFRIWEIPTHAVHGLLGYFNPALPYSADELRGMGFDTQDGRYTTPVPDEHMLGELFGDLAGEVRATCMKEGRLLPAYATQRKVAARFPGDDERQTRLREGLMALLDDVLFIEDPRRKGYFHPRIAPHSTHAYRRLDGERRAAFDRLYTDFFYHRHNRFWQESALRKLPVLLSATEMLTCGEDLGMIPDSVPETMHELQILSLEIQRMPKTPGELFADPAHYPYFSVCTTSTHDMNPLRAWWEEDRELTARFYHEALGIGGDVPYFCEPWICRRILDMHLNSPAMLTILPLQDWLSTDGELRYPDPAKERINVPSIPRYHWRYRMHLPLEELLRKETFNESLHDMIACSGRR